MIPISVVLDFASRRPPPSDPDINFDAIDRALEKTPPPPLRTLTLPLPVCEKPPSRVAKLKQTLSRLLPLALLALVSCGGSEGGSPASPTPTTPTVAGTYTNGSAIWIYELTRLNDNALITLRCGGSATISQAGASFSGSFRIVDGDCDPTPQTGTLVNGAVRSDGGLNFAISVPGSSGDYLANAFGCVTLSGDTAFNGAITGTRIDAKQTLLINCPSDGRISVVFRVTGSR